MVYKDMCIIEAIDEFILYLCSRRGSSKATEVTYRSILKHFAYFVENAPINSITIEQIDLYAEAIYARQLAPKTFYSKMAAIRGLFKFLYAKNVCDLRPESIELPVVQEQEANFLEPHEQEQLINACQDIREEAIIRTFISSGLRISELIDLHINDISGRSVLVRKGKGSKPRITFITQNTLDVLTAYLATKPYTTHVFTNMSGEPLSRQYVARIVSKCADRAQLNKKVSPHTLRHTFCTNLLRNGARVEDARPIMGHANIRTTQIYMHFTNQYLHEQYDKYMQS